MFETLSPHQTRNVLVAVDVQNDFIDGSLAVPRGRDVVRPINEIAHNVRRHPNGTVVFTRDHHPEKTPHFDTWPVHCVQNTWGEKFISSLDVRPRDIILSKGMGQTDGYSGMEGVGPRGETLETILTPKRNERVRAFIAGLATDYCVKATTLDVAERFRRDPNTELYVVRDAMRAVNIHARDEINALHDMERAGAIALTSDEIKRIFFER